MTKVTRLVIYFYLAIPNVRALQGCNSEDRNGGFIRHVGT